MYHFKEVVLKNGEMEKKVLAIEFAEPKMAIVGEFLMADATLMNDSILEDIRLVSSGARDYKETSGNRCALLIKRDKTQIEDLFVGMLDDVDVFPSYEIDTKRLRELICMWRDKQMTFQKRG